MSDLLKKTVRILLVDDHEMVAEGIALMIKNAVIPMEVVGIVTNCFDALKASLELKPDIVLLDLTLGAENGIDIIPNLVKQKGVRVLVLTASTDSEVFELSILKGASGVLLKGETGKTLIRALEKIHAGEIWASNSTIRNVINKIAQSGGKSAKAIEVEKKLSGLTGRENEIIKALFSLESSTNKQIASRLFISPSTLKNHLNSIYGKLDVKNRHQLMNFLITYQVIETIDIVKSM